MEKKELRKQVEMENVTKKALLNRLIYLYDLKLKLTELFTYEKVEFINKYTEYNIGYYDDKEGMIEFINTEINHEIKEIKKTLKLQDNF